MCEQFVCSCFLLMYTARFPTYNHKLYMAQLNHCAVICITAPHRWNRAPPYLRFSSHLLETCLKPKFWFRHLALFSTLSFSRCIWVCPFLLGFLPALVFWKRTLRINAAGFYRPDILSSTQPAMTKHCSELKALTQ